MIDAALKWTRHMTKNYRRWKWHFLYTLMSHKVEAQLLVKTINRFNQRQLKLLKADSLPVIGINKQRYNGWIQYESSAAVSKHIKTCTTYPQRKWMHFIRSRCSDNITMFIPHVSKINFLANNLLHRCNNKERKGGKRETEWENEIWLTPLSTA